jgi:glycine cleavage system protein P-like pyridoxal-binding family
MIQKGFNLLVEELKLKLVTAIQQSNLPIGACTMVFNEVHHDIINATNETLEKEHRAYEEAVRKEAEDSTDVKQI